MAIRGRWLGAGALVLAELFLVLSLVSYTPADIPGAVYPANRIVRNVGGLLGANLAYLLYRSLGIGAWVLVLLSGFWTVRILLRRRIPEFGLKLLSGLILVLCVSTILSIQPWVGVSEIGLEETTVSAGGVYGRALQMILVPHVGLGGTLLFLALLMGTSAVLASDWVLVPSASRPSEGHTKVGPSCAPGHTKVGPSCALGQTKVGPSCAPAYRQPPLDIFEARVERLRDIRPEEVEDRKRLIQDALAEYSIEAEVVRHESGPTVTTYLVEPGPGVRISRLVGLAGELSMRLHVPNVRVAPLPGRGTVGIEVPNPFPNTVRIREFLEGPERQAIRRTALPLFLGKASQGEELVRDLADMPHLLLAGTTGSGKSVCLKASIVSLVCARAPEELKLVLIDPKMAELPAFEGIPHLWAPVVTDARRAARVLEWLVKEMEDRYRLFSRLQVANLASFNSLPRRKVEERLRESGLEADAIARTPYPMPFVVVVIDELADLMFTSGREVEQSIVRLTQKARAVGIHIIAATQRPSADVVTGLIKSNMPARIAFQVVGHIDSMIILDRKGAERLLGKGDMLVLCPGMDAPLRAQCTFVSDHEVKKLVDYLRGLGEPKYREEILEIDTAEAREGTSEDDQFEQAVRIILEAQTGSTSLLQRRLGIGYPRAARLIEAMEKAGIVGPYNKDKPREVLLTLAQWEKARERTPARAGAAARQGPPPPP